MFLSFIMSFANGKSQPSTMCQEYFSVCSDRLKVWDPFKSNYRSICGYGNLTIEDSSKLHMTEGGTKAILLSGGKLLRALPLKEWEDFLGRQTSDMCLSSLWC